MMKMMGKMKEAQEKMKEIKNQLDTIKVESESGAGLVKVQVNGKKDLYLNIGMVKQVKE